MILKERNKYAGLFDYLFHRDFVQLSMVFSTSGGEVM